MGKVKLHFATTLFVLLQATKYKNRNSCRTMLRGLVSDSTESGQRFFVTSMLQISITSRTTFDFRSTHKSQNWHGNESAEFNNVLYKENRREVSWKLMEFEAFNSLISYQSRTAARTVVIKLDSRWNSIAWIIFISSWTLDVIKWQPIGRFSLHSSLEKLFDVGFENRLN